MHSLRFIFVVLLTGVLGAFALGVEPVRPCGFADGEETQDSSQGVVGMVIEQKMETKMVSGTLTMKVKGDLVRYDYPQEMGRVSILINTKSGEYQMLMHDQKMLMKMPLDTLKKQAQQQQKASGIDPAKIEKAKPTGKKEKVGPWDAEIFETKVGEEKMRIWVVKDYPNYRGVQARLRGLSSMTGGMDPQLYDLGGLIVKYEMNNAPAGLVTLTILRIHDEKLTDADFKVPDDYRVQEIPNIGCE